MSLGILELENNSEIQKAYNYFSVLQTQNYADASVSQKNGFSGINEYGMVDLVQLFNKGGSGKQNNDLCEVMANLNNIMIAAVLKHAEGDSKKEVDAEGWRAGFNAMASLFFSSYSIEKLSYHDKKVGKEIVEEVLKIGFDVNGQPEGHLMDAITLYLQQQGKLLDELTFNGSYSAPYTLIDFVCFNKDNKRICGLRAYFTEFTSNTVRIKQSCKDDKKQYDFDFDITHCNADFMISNWESSAIFRDRVNEFIKTHTPSEDYFDSVKTSHNFTV